MTQPARRRGGLGRGLASLIPTGPADGGPRLGEAAAPVPGIVGYLGTPHRRTSGLLRKNSNLNVSPLYTAPPPPFV